MYVNGLFSQFKIIDVRNSAQFLRNFYQDSGRINEQGFFLAERLVSLIIHSICPIEETNKSNTILQIYWKFWAVLIIVLQKLGTGIFRLGSFVLREIRLWSWKEFTLFAKNMKPYPKWDAGTSFSEDGVQLNKQKFANLESFEWVLSW